MNLGIQINRAVIALSAFMSVHKKGRIDNKTIYIIFQQIFGDSVVIQNSLKEYTKLYPKSGGWDVHFLTRPSVLKFMKDTMPLPSDITFEAVDFKLFLEDYRYYKKILRQFSDKAGVVIVPGTSLSAEIFSCSTNAYRKIGLIRSIDVQKPWVYAYFYRHAYTETIRPEKEDMMLLRHRKLIHYLGNKEYRAELPQLLPKENIIGSSYAVMCPGSSKQEKCWPIERFAEIADYIVEKYDLEVHLCGGKDEEGFAIRMMEKANNKERIVSHIGKTSFSDWSSIVQHAKLVVGNDSATMHLAAAGRVPSVCVAGVYDKYQFFPYKVDLLNEHDLLPVTVLRDIPCEWCRTMGYDAGYGNEGCKKRIETGLCSTCIDLITVDEIKKAIDDLLERNNSNERS